MLKGILIAGHEFGTGNDNVLALSSRFIESMRAICAGEQIALDEATEAALREWSSGVVGWTWPHRGCASSADQLSSSLTDEADLHSTRPCLAPLFGRLAQSQKPGVGRSDPFGSG